MNKQQQKSDIIMQAFRKPTGIMRMLNLAVLAFFVTTFYAPSALAIKTGIEEQEKQSELEASLPQNRSDTAQYTHKLKQMKGHFQEAERLYTDKQGGVIGHVTDIDNAIETGGSLFRDDDRWRQELTAGLALAADAVSLNSKVDKDFKDVKKWIKAQELPELFNERYKEAYGQYESRYNEFANKLKPLQRAKNEDQTIAALKEINAFLKDQQFGRKHQPKNEALGNSLPKSAKDKPLLLTQNDYFRAGMESNPAPKLAALGDFDFSNLPNADDPAFLAESDEVTLSQAIRDQAAELQHDPVLIYHWVRNNIETIPGYGSYQNADLTLGAQRGNPFDVASLLIALLRASEIPARYAMGVAEIEADQYTNWLGDFANVDVAIDYAVSNGVAIQAVTSGGEIVRVRSQHVWVQAAIDYFPSRGAKNRSADAWVDLDASFKQYEYQQGLDFVDATGIDAEALATQFTNSGTVDNDTGFVQNLNPSELIATQEQAQEDLEAFIENNITDQTLGDAISGRRAIVKEYPTLPSGLPYVKFNEGATFAVVPSNLQNKAAVGFGSNRVTFPFAQVNNQKVTLQFTPATQADEDALAALLPEDDIVELSQLPTSIPSFLVRVIPELTLNGEVFLRGDTMRLGDETILTYQFSGPVATYAPVNYGLVAGSFVNVPLISQTVSPAVLQDLQTRVEQTQALLESGDQTQISSLTRENLLGDLFYAGGLGYYAQSLGLSQLAATQSRGSQRLETGFGSFGYEPSVDSFFGVPRAIETGGVALNMLFVHSAQSRDGDNDQRVALRFQVGLISSALEHAVPEQMFSDPNNPAQGFSTVRALELASQQGQRIYQIDQSNLNATIADLRLDRDVEAQIRDSILAGKVVITHTDNVQVPGFTGSGYIIMDSDTGAASFNISGGGNGGFFERIQNNLNRVLFNLALIIDAGPQLTRVVAAVPQAALIVNAISAILSVVDAIEDCPNGFDIFKAIAVIALVLFVSTAVFSISVANPFLGFAIIGAELAFWSRIESELTGLVCQ